MNKRLSGQRVAIVGGSGQMGAATARHVVAEGGHVALIGRNETALQDVASTLGAAAQTAVCDASNDKQLHSVLANLAADHIVVAVSAKANARAIADTPTSEAKQAFGRLWVSYSVLNMASQVLISTGSVTLLSGSSARTAAPGLGVWTALHGSIEALAKAATIDIAPIRVNVVSPGGIGLQPDRQLVERANTADDIASAIVSLIANPAITGAVLDVDGGERRGTWSGNAAQ